ncbi:MAG: PD40 domain-containing protein [Bacteroidales bacterium]|nr:PD40 domain-containing protein [Bacteroidales bacterium]
MRKLTLFIIISLQLCVPVMKADEARLLRFPSVGGDKIAFTYAGDLYTVSITGGKADKLTSHIGYETFSRFSPDGKTIAFTGQYDGNTEVYLIPAEGGVPERLTYTPTLQRDDIGDRMGPNNIVMCWTPDGKSVVFRTRWYTFSGLRGLLYQAPVDGSDLKQIPTTEGGFCSYSPDGKYLAMNRMFREFRTWKYYKGGQADDIWINKVGTTQLENITNNPAQDIFPMWIGEEIYFMSDRDHTMNLFCYNTKTKETVKVTDFTEYDCKFPSYSSKYIVFENAGYIYRYSVADKKCEKVHIEVVSDDLYSRSKLSEPINNSNDNLYKLLNGGISLSPDATRIATYVRGEILSIPTDKGVTYNLTSSPGAHERNPAWSPDGKKLAYFSDASGEYQVYVMDPNDLSSAKCMTSLKSGYPTGLKWSPDSQKLFFINEKDEMLMIDLASSTTKVLFKASSSSGHTSLKLYRISPDGKWILYVEPSDNTYYVIRMHNIAEGKSYTISSNMYNSFQPIFSDDSKYVFFISSRNFSPSISSVEWNVSYSNDHYVFAIPLSKETPVLTSIKGNNTSEKSVTKSGEIKLDIDGILDRTFVLPLPAAKYSLIACYDNVLYFVKNGKSSKLDLKTMKHSEISKKFIMEFTPDGKKALVNSSGKAYIVNVPSMSGNQDPVEFKNTKVMIDYEKEWKQIFDETWRIYRDYFYVANMHGKDWKAIHDKYAEFLPYVKHRHDLTYIIGEMIAELTVGHAYVSSGQAPRAERIKLGLLGGKFSKTSNGNFRIEKIFAGQDWDESLYSPLGQPGLGVEVGDYIVGINGMPASSYKNIYEALIGKAGEIIELKVSDKPSGESARTIYVKTISDESKLAYYEWVQNNIQKVNELSNGQIGYIHIPDMSMYGLEQFTKLFYSQLNKKALIIDDRMNGGGNVSPIIMERLQREIYRLNASRHVRSTLTVPNAAHYGPKVCLVDKYSSSDGDLFPYGFKKLALGPVIGTRTWGGVVGISASMPYMDGQDVRTPSFASYSTEGEWIIENHGVDPDIVVDINPFEDYKGNDAQLNKAVEYLLEQLKSYKPLPGTPADRVME